MIYYLYRHIRLDKYEPFYIGIGRRKKDYNKYKRAYRIDNRTTFWKNIIAKTDYKVEILLESEDLKYIRKKETEFIKLYGRRNLGKGTLVNLTDGGETGDSNRVISTENRKRLSESAKNNEAIKATQIKPGQIFNEKKLIKVYDILSEETFNSITEAANYEGIKASNLVRMLSGERWNSSRFIRLEDKGKSLLKKPKKEFSIETKNKLLKAGENTRIKKGQILDSNRLVKVLDKETKIIYSSIAETARTFNLNRRTLNAMLNNDILNTTNFIKYV